MVLGNFSLTRFFPRHFTDRCKIPWHFQVFQTSGHPVMCVYLCGGSPRLVDIDASVCEAFYCAEFLHSWPKADIPDLEFPLGHHKVHITAYISIRTQPWPCIQVMQDSAVIAHNTCLTTAGQLEVALTMARVDCQRPHSCSIVCRNAWLTLPPGCAPIGCNWTLLKRKSFGAHRLNVSTRFNKVRW